MKSEVAGKADFSGIRYAQCWEDADILLSALNIQPGGTCLSIASAGDNALAMLTSQPARVIAVDLSAAQLACLELRVAAYRELTHAELLELIGSRPSARRSALYKRCRGLLSTDTRSFWDSQGDLIEKGIGSPGKFENYFSLFRRRILPFIHSRKTVRRLLEGGTRDERIRFYEKKWNNLRWRFLFRIFFSRFAMGKLGRDPSFFQYVEGSVSERILSRARYALTELDPAENPYLQWILTGRHTTALPFALREENFELIRENLNALEWHQCAIESLLEKEGDDSFDACNLSDIFEYMSEENYYRLLERLVWSGKSGGRLAYWNMLVPRSRPDAMADDLKALPDLSQELFDRDKAFFYSRFVVEEII